MAEQFCLKWNNFFTNIVTSFGSLQSTEELTDVTLACEGLRIKAHKVILSACSPYFRSIFKDNPCPHPVVILKDVLYSDLVAILNFIYHGEVLVTQDKLASFLQTAVALQVKGLVGNELTSNSANELSPKKVKTPKTKVTVTPEIQAFEKIETSLDSIEIKSELEDSDDKLDYEAHGRSPCSSILEAALEVKEPSILERSLTSCTSKSPLNDRNDVEVEKLTKHKLIDSSIESPSPKLIRYDDENVRNYDVNLQGLPTDISVITVRTDHDVQPHHSSQCGTCPHCGKIYSNQSALKYHVRLVHSDLTNMYCCHLCPESFDYREGYKKHMVDVHSVKN